MSDAFMRGSGGVKKGTDSGKAHSQVAKLAWREPQHGVAMEALRTQLGLTHLLVTRSELSRTACQSYSSSAR
jgi:hypothetical protein